MYISPGTLIIFLRISKIFCIDVLRFDDPKDSPNEDFKIGNITDDNYEIELNLPQVSFPIGQDLTICYRWFFDQIRFNDPGGFNIHVKLYMNMSDEEGIDETIIVETRVIPNIREKNRFLNLAMKDFIANLNWQTYKILRQTTWYNNLMTESGTFSLIRPQYWRSFCHLMDWKNRRTILVINGGSFFSWETVEYSEHFTDDDKEWPKAKLKRISFGPQIQG